MNRGEQTEQKPPSFCVASKKQRRREECCLEADVPVAPECWRNEDRVSTSEWHRKVAGGQDTAHVRPPGLASQQQCESERRVDAREEKPCIADPRERERI